MRLIVTHIEAKLPAARTSHAHPYPLTTGSLKTQQTKKHGNHPMSRVFCFACAKRRFRLPIACVLPPATITARAAAIAIVIIAVTAVAVAIAHIDAGAVVAPAVADIEAVVGIEGVAVISVVAAVAAVIIIIAVTAVVAIITVVAAVVAIVVIVSPAPFVCAVAAVNVYSAAVKLNSGAVVAVIH